MSGFKLDLGLIAEGVVELDPMSGRYVIRTEDEKGQIGILDIQARLEQYQGEDVRFILTPLKTVNQLAEMVESGDIDASQIPTLKL